MSKETKLSLFSCYQSLLPVEYGGLVKISNEQRLSELRLLLNYFFLPSSAAIIVVGSDGKLERHPQSKTELVVLVTNEDEGLKLSRELTEYFHSIGEDSCFGLSSKDLPEYKIVGSQAFPVSYFLGRKDSVYPDRALNSQLIVGDEELFIKLRQQALEEISDEGHLGKRIREKMKKQLGDYRNARRTGYYRGRMIFNLDSNLQFYNEAEDDMRTGFKTSHLRAVQRQLDLVTSRGIRKRLIVINQETIQNLPTNTEERLYYFAKLGIITGINIDEIAEAYLWFLQRYHEVQEYYKNRKTVVSLEFDRELFDRYNGVISQFVNQPIENLIR